MSWWEICIIIAAALFVVAVATFSIIRRKQGKTCCDCGCGKGAQCARCHEARKKASGKTPEE